MSLRTTERLDLDHKDLYEAIRRPCYFTPTPEDIFPELSDVSCFSILDAWSGYWNIKLKWVLLCISFNSPFGRYRFLHLPFGLISAPDMFQRMIDETFGDLPGVTVIADNFVYGCNDCDHDENLHAFLQCACETSLHFYLDKFDCAPHPVHQSHNWWWWFADWLAQVWLHTFHGSINQPCNLAGMSQDCSVGLHNCSPPQCHQEDKWICLKHSTSVDCISSNRLYQESDHNPYFAAIPWQYPASYWSGVFRGNRRNLQKLVVSNEVPKERACVQQFLYINASGTCSPAKKQTLFLLQILLLSEDPLGEWKPRKDWTYDCTHCLIFSLYS